MKNELLRHTLATIDYRFRKSVSNAGKDFGSFRPGKNSRTPTEIVNHIFQVLSATRTFIETETFSSEPPEELKLSLEIDRFKSELKTMDLMLSRQELDIEYTKKLIQGPFSDVLTHIGQLSMLGGLNGSSIKGEDFSAALIKTGIE